MVERAEIIRVMRDYFARPSSWHTGIEITWVQGMPRLPLSQLALRENDEFLLNLYHEAVRRSGHQIDFFGDGE